VHDALFWRSGHYRALRAGDWKLQVSVRPQRTWLFDLAADPTEQQDLAGTRPDKLTELQERLAALEQEMAKPLWPALVEGTVAIDHDLVEPLEPGDEYVYWAN
ncbi:sulfatase, partial [Myxococcota bacterium]|nr:sulfatase [Myxococcota bacterium]